MVEYTSNETIRIESKIAVKRKFVETLDDTSFSILNEMVNPVDEITSESEIDELYESVENFIKANKEEIENLDFGTFLINLKKIILHIHTHAVFCSYALCLLISSFVNV